LIQLLNDLYRLGDLPAKLTGDLCSTFTAIYGTVRNLAKELRESFRRDRIRLDAGPDPGTIQIRLPDPPFLFLLGS
jgi:hypothetical protein